MKVPKSSLVKEIFVLTAGVVYYTKQEEKMEQPLFKYWKIIGVACLDQHGRTWHMPVPGFRHHNVLQLMRGSGSEEIEQGFYVINHLGKTQFASRKLSLLIAKDNGQLNRKQGPGTYQGNELYSEDLW